MSMYKNIFVNENDDASASVQIQGIDGEVKSFGATAFSSVEEAIAGVTAEYGNAVIRVASGKYDTYYVVANDGVYSAPSKVIAVDFTGGTVVSGEKEIAIDAPGFDAEEQLSIISELNDNNAANGTIFVAEGEVADTTIVVGMGEANYIAGQSADAAYGADAEEVYTVLNNMLNVDMLAATEVASGQNVYFSSTNSSQTYVFKAGSVAHNELSKWDMTGAVTIEGGAKLVAGRNNAAAIAANTPQTAHIKNTLTLAGTADNKAVLNFLSDTRQDASLGILYNGKLVAEHAEISVADLGFTGTASMSDCTVYVDGVVAFGKNTFYKQTMTNTTMNVRGHNRHNENKYFSTEGVILNNLTMTNSSINVDNGVDGAPEKVTIKKLTMNDSKVITEGALEITGTLTIDSDSLLQMDSLTFGSSGKITLNLLNGFTGGKIIDITGATGLTEDILSKITLKGATDGLSVGIVDGDIFVVDESAALEFKDEEHATLTDKVVAQNVELTNSKKLAVEEGIHATDSAKITNAKVEGEPQGTLNGGYDGNKELAAKITAENNIVLQNDGHANVDLDAKTIIIANNSKNTLIGNIGTADTEKVIIADGEASADGVTIDDNGVVDGAIKNATITAANIEIGGQEVSETTINGYTEIISDSSFTDVATSGIVSVGYKNENAADTTLTMAGETSIGTLYVGNEGRENEYKAVISGEDTDVSLVQLYNRLGSTLEITDGAHLAVSNYWQSKGDVVIDGASAELTGVNMYVYNNDTTDAATITLRNGASLSTNANYAIYLGNSEGGPAKGNASMTLESGSSLNVKNLILHADGEVEEVAGAKASTSVSVTDSTLNVSGTMTNNGTVTVGGESTLNIAAATGKAIDFADGAVITSETGANFSDATHYIGGVTFGSGKFNFAGAAYVSGGDLTLTAGAEVAAATTLAFYNNATIADGASVSGNSVYVNGGDITLNGNLTAKGDDGGLLLRNSGKSFNVDGGNVDVAYIEGTRGTVAVNLTNATVKGGHHITDNGGTLNWNIDNSSVSARTWAGAGDIEVNNGEITVTETLTNNGTFTVSGDSTLKIAELSGSYIRALDGTTLTDTTIASTTNVELVVGEDDVASTVTFDGANSIAKISAGNGDKIVVTADGSLALTGARSGFGSGAEWDIDGNIADAKAVTAEEKAAMTADLHLVQGLSISDYSGAESVMNVDNAYFKFNNQISTKNDNSAGGKFTMNFTNSIVDSTAKIAINRSKDSVTNAPEIEMNFKDSAVNIGNYFTNNHEKSTVTIDNTDFTATAFGNTGKFDVKNGSDVEFSLVNAVGDWQSKGSLNAGDISVDNADLTIKNSGVSLDFYNVGDITLSNGASLTIDKLVNAAANDVTAGSINTIFADQVGNIEVADATLIATSVSNAGTINVSGESTLKIGTVTNTDDDATRIQIADGTTLVESNVGGYINLQGSLTVEDGLTVGAIRAGNPVGEEVTNSVISGDKITVSGNGRFQNGTYKINADMHFDQYVYLSYGGTFTITSDLTAGTTPQQSDGAFWINGNVTLKDGASMVATNGGNIIFNNDTDTVLTVEAGAMVSVYDISDYKKAAVLNVSGSVSASHVVSQIGEINVTDGTLSAEYFKNLDINSINLTVTDEKLASLGGDSYVMLEQTTSNGHPYEFDLSGVGVTYKGETYYVGGKSIVIDGVEYKVTAGDGNDIAIEAQAKTVLLDSSIEGNGFNKFSQAGDFFELHDSYDESIKGNPEKIVVNGTNVLDTDKSKYYFYTDSDLSISGGTLDVSEAGRFYFMDTVAANGTAASDADFSDVATVTIEEGATLKGYINLGQAIDNEDVDADGNVTRDGGAANMVVKGTLDHKNIYVTSGSTLTVTETGKVTNYADGGDNHIRANAKVVVNGTGKDGDVQFASNWWSIRGGEMEFNNTNAQTGTLRLNADNENALITGDTTASLTVNNSRLDAYTIEVDNADSSFTATGSEVTVTNLLENYGSMSFDNSTVTAGKVTNSGTLNVDGGQLKANSIANAGALNIFNSTLENTVITGSEGAVFRAENAVLSNLNVSGQETRTVNTDFNGGTYTGKVYTGYGLVDGEWSRVTDSETTITGTVDASSVYWQNYGKLTIAEGAELKTSYFSEGSRQVLTVDGTISAGTFRGYNGVVSETGKINAKAAVQFYGNPDTKRQYDINGEVVVTHDTAYAHNIVVGFDTAKQWYGDGPNDYWNIGGANTEVNVSGEKAKLQIVAGKAGKGTAMIHVDEEGTRATLNISDKAQFLVDGKVINNGNLNIADNAVAVITGNVTNSGSITVDASSSFSAGSIVNNGTFNSDNAGEMIVLGDMTVTGNIQTTDLTLKAGAALSAGSITVTNLNLTLGSTLTLTSSAVSTVTGTISVFGEFSPENAEFVLVAQNWNSLGASDIFYDADNNGLIDGDTEKFTIGSSDKDYTFTVDANGNLVMSKTQATASSLFIGDYESGDVETEVVGDKTYVIVNGMRYEVGVSAFKSATEAAAVTDAGKVTEITAGECDHLNAIADNFSNVEKIIIPAGMSIEDDTLAQFTKAHIEIVNDGHLDADVKASGKLTVSNTSFNTLIGSADAAVYELNNSGAVEDYTVMAQNITVNNSGSGTLTDTMLNAGTFGTVNINDDGTGTFTNVDVVADSLNLKDVKELTLDADSEVYSVRMDGDAGILTLDGAKVDTVYGSGYTADGEVIFTDKSGLANTSIEILDTVTLSGGSHEFGGSTDNREYYFDNLSMGDAELTWKWNDDQSLEYNIGTTPDNVDDGMIDVTNSADTAKLTFAQTGNYSLDGFDVSAFDALVNINQNAALTLEEATDYFADGAELTVDGALNLNGTGAFTGTGMDFNGSGDINVNTDHTFTADAALNGFNGELTVADDVLLTLDGANDTAATLLGAGDVKANDALTLSQTGAINGFTGNIEANGSTVTLEAVNTTSATFSGNGTLDLQNDQTFEADGALNGLTGTLNNGGFELALDGINAVGATVTGSGNITANADQSFSGDVSAYTGSYTTAANTVTFTDASTLAANMTLNGAGKFVFDSQDANVTVTGDNAETNLCINDNNFTLIGGKYSYITGTTGSVLTIDSNISATEVAVDGLVIKAGDNLTAGKVTASTTVVYIEDTTFAGPAITVTDTDSSFGNIMVSSWSSAFETPFTIVDSSNGQTYNATVVFVKTGSGALGTSITVDDKAELIDGKFVRVYTQDGDLLIGNYEATSNVVYVNSDWSTVSGDVEKWTVSNTNSPEDTDRIIDRDASKTLENAVNIIKADVDGKGQIYVVKGDSYIAPAALMNDVNGLKELTITGESFYDFNNAQTQIGLGDVTIDGNVVALTNAGSGKLTLENVSVRGNVYGGAVVNGTAGSNADATSVKLDGGLYISSNIAGGSFVEDGDFSVGATGVEIVNNSGDRMTVSGRVLGGSIVAGANASVTQDSASVKVDVSNGNEITIRGDIYAAGHNTLGGSLTVTNTNVTFTGDAADLVFTGRVSGGAFGGSATVTNSNLIFDDFTGTFKGLVQEFNTITISGDTELEFSRKQTLMGETDFVFDLTERTANDADAMFTVNQFGWTYGDIIVNSGMFVSGDYILASGADFSAVDIYVDDQLFSGSEIEVNGNKYQFVINDNGTADTSDDTLTLTYTNVSGMAVNNGIAKVDSSATVSGNDAFADISEVVLADQADLSMELSGNNLSGLKLTTEDGKTADVTITDTDPTNWNNIFGDGLEIGKGISADITGYIVGYSDITIDGEVNMLGGESDSYFYMYGGDLNVSGKLNSGSSTLQIKGGSVATITGEVKAVHTNIWGSGSSQMVIDGGSVVCNNGDGNVSLTVYAGGHDLTLKNGGKLTVSQVNLNQSGSQSDDPTIASTVNVLSGSQVNGAIVGGAMNDTITIDVDAVLNGTLNLGDGTADMLNVTGFENIESTGAVALTGSISNVEKFAINGVDDALNNAVKVSDAGTPDTADDIWAKLAQTSDGSLVVAWGNDDQQIADALDAFNQETFEIGKAVIADGTGFDTLTHDEFVEKKNNGTLA